MPVDFSTEAWRVFDRWLAEHHPDDSDEDESGEFFGIFEALEAFHRWARTNSIEKYLDANQPASALSSQDRGTEA